MKKYRDGIFSIRNEECAMRNDYDFNCALRITNYALIERIGNWESIRDFRRREYWRGKLGLKKALNKDMLKEKIYDD
ncbi:MAG: hypothetical protein IKI08_04900 [Selenomonadaceae bacterium]|nr:hypothetical protein [Selenomonadaceae bacterium]